MEDDRVILFQLEDYKGPSQMFEWKSECQTLTDIPVAKSAHNWTGETVWLYESRDCQNRYFSLGPDESRPHFTAFPAARSVRGESH